MNTKNQNNQTEQQTPDNTKTNPNDINKEVNLPVPEKKNDDITTGTKPEKGQGSNGATVLYDDDKAGKIKEEDNGKSNLTGKDAKLTTDKEDSKTNENEKRGDETKRLERDETTNPKTKDASWQQDKMNEANNQQGDKDLMVEGTKTGNKNKGEDWDNSGTKKDLNNGGQTKDTNNPDQRRRQNEERERQQNQGKTGSTSKDTGK